MLHCPQVELQGGCMQVSTLAETSEFWVNQARGGRVNCVKKFVLGRLLDQRTQHEEHVISDTWVAAFWKWKKKNVVISNKWICTNMHTWHYILKSFNSFKNCPSLLFKCLPSRFVWDLTGESCRGWKLSPGFTWPVHFITSCESTPNRKCFITHSCWSKGSRSL